MKAAALVLAGAGVCATAACNATTDDSSESCEALERRPVLFVHGSGLSSSSWNSMMQSLVAAGYRADWLRAVDLEPNDGANVGAAKQFIAPAVAELLDRARSIAQRSNCRAPLKADIVAHSMGAVSSRWFTARMQPERVHTWIGIAPANHGTDKLCGYSGGGNREMCPSFANSGVQAQLNGSKREPQDETPYGVGADQRTGSHVAPTSGARIYYYTLRIEPDEWIEPAGSAILDGAGGLQTGTWPAKVRESTPGNLLWQDRIAHDSLPGDGDVAALVLQLLTAGAP